MLRYKYPVGDFHILFNGGLSYGFPLETKNHHERKTIMISIETIRENDAVEKIRKNETRLILGTGLIYGRFSLEYRYERGNGMSAYGNLGSLTNTNMLLLGYRF